MNKLLLFYLAGVSIILFSCKRKCSIDVEFKKEFDNCILLVQKINEKGYTSNMNVRFYTYECLYAVTGYEGHVDKGNEPHYFYPYNDTIDYVKLDIKEWTKWYNLNKCTMTKSKADSLIIIHAKECGNLNWPPPVDKAVTYEDLECKQK